MHTDLYTFALRTLGRKSYTSFEVAEKLRKKFPGRNAEVSAVITRLEEEELLNDTRYMESAVAYAYAYRTWSLRMLRYKLMRRGLDATELQHYLRDVDHYDERVILERVWNKSFEASPSEEEVQRFIRRMEQKGFFLATILEIVSRQKRG